MKLLCLRPRTEPEGRERKRLEGVVAETSSSDDGGVADLNSALKTGKR